MNRTAPRNAMLIVAAIVAAAASLHYFGRANESKIRTDQEASSPSTTQLVSHFPSNRPIEAPTSGYVGSEACEQCHAHEHAMWHQSFHRTMTQTVSPATVLGKFDGATLESHSQAYRHIRKDDKFFVEMSDPFWQGDGVAPKVRRELVMSTGSHHMQVYWYEAGDHRKLIQSPFAYLLAEQRWVPVQSTFLKPPLESMHHVVGGWNQACNMCHATGARPRLHNPNAIDTQVSEFGIACEACHGPGQEHINFRNSELTSATGKNSDSIFNPNAADPLLSSQACGQCHGIWVARSPQDFVNWQEHGFEYRPGDDLAERRYVLTGNAKEDGKHAAGQLQADPNFLRDRFWSDGMVRISGREYNALVQSPCYKHEDPDKGILQCTSCHQMHPESANGDAPPGWSDDQMIPDLTGNDSCLQCHHELRDEQLELHTHHAVDSTGSQCMNCHMPHTTYGLFKAIRSHQISSPSVQESLDTGRPNACNQCHLDQTFDWTARHLSENFGVARPGNMRALHSRYAAAPLWALAGDAGQRALTAWSMGWQPAQQASKTDWMVPYLAQLLIDPYDAVRLIAFRSLKTIPGYQTTDYDFLASAKARETVAQEVLGKWTAAKESRSRTGRELLIAPSGQLIGRTWKQMYEARDNRRVSLEE